YKPEYAVIASIAASLVILTIVIGSTIPLIEQLEELFSATNMPAGYIEIMLKAMGICFITQIACDTCKDAGESSIGSKIEMSGKIAVLLVALPLFKNLLDIAIELIQR
ncbi:MAG: SpoIIIAC/SpoIIIAD family protein, partial [Oscillospiraceae bacterium]